MRSISAFFSGILFAVGLVISGLTNPVNVIGFLDFFGEWKPALAFVMIGGIGIYALLYPLVLKRRIPLFAPAFDLPDAGKATPRLIAGAAAFGIGWGIGGVCPGPAITSLGTGASEVLVFTGSLLFGIGLFHIAFRSGDPAAGDGPSTCG